MEEYPTNPNQLPQPQQPDRSKVKGKEVQKSKFEKFLDDILNEDVKSIKKYFVVNVLLPRIGKIIMDLLDVNGTASTTNVGTGQTDYNSVSSVRVLASSNMVQPYKDETTKRYSFKQLGYVSEQEANEVLAQLRDDIQRYKRATLLSYYEYSDISTESTEANWGWKDLSTAYVTWDTNSQTYVIKLPKVIHLD